MRLCADQNLSALMHCSQQQSWTAYTRAPANASAKYKNTETNTTLNAGNYPPNTQQIGRVSDKLQSA